MRPEAGSSPAVQCIPHPSRLLSDCVPNRFARPIVAILIILSIWLYACDRSNEFMPWVALVGTLALTVPMML
jgi:hypothetical protein